MEFIFVLAMILFEILFINLLKVMQIVRAFRINAFMYDEMFAIFLVRQVVRTMRAFERQDF